MKKILILGSTGQIGYEVQGILKLNNNYKILCPDRTKLNLSNVDIVKYCKENMPDFIVNCAAETNVDGIENGIVTANNINLNLTLLTSLGTISKRFNIPIIHISTDYVFNGVDCPELGWNENSLTNPLNEYGRYKLQGETALSEQTNMYYILRTSWVYSFQRNNFVKTMFNVNRTDNKELSIVNDQWGHPTSASEIAMHIFSILESKNNYYGTYHVCGSEYTNWADFSKKIFSFLNSKVKVKGISSEEYKEQFNSYTERPKNNKMDCSKFFNTFNINQLNNDIFLKDTLKKLKEIYKSI